MEQDIASAYAVFAAATTYATAENVTTGVAVMSQEWDSIGEKQGFTMGDGEAEYTAGRGGGHASLQVLTPEGDRHESDMWWGDGVKIKRGNHTLYTEVCVKRVVQQSAMRGPYEKPTRLKSVMRGPDEQIYTEEENVEKVVDNAAAVEYEKKYAVGNSVKIKRGNHTLYTDVSGGHSVH